MQFGAKPLFENVSVKFGNGNRYGLIGANGCGKSTFMKILGNDLEPSAGQVMLEPNVRLGKLRQDQFAYEDFSVIDTVIMGHEELWAVKAERDRIYSLPEMSEADGMAVAELEVQFAEFDGYTAESRAGELLLGLGIPLEQHFGPMSAVAPGWKLRVLLAQALFSDPDVLLLDEPTNHLDIGAIAWLEEALLGFNGAVLFITHDRAFLQSLATRILELDRGHLIDWNGDYASFLVHKEQQLAAEEAANALFDKRLAQEEVWIRQGIKARRTRNEGRVRALKEMRRERAERRERQGKASFQLESADKSGKQVIVVEHVSFAHPGGQPLVRDFSMVLQRGDRIGLLGANGTGKTTLLKLLLGDLQPTSGKIEVGTKLEVAYFDQLRHQLEPEQTVIDNISEGREFITIDGQNRHVLSYLGDFLFSPQRARTPVKALSGGERARLLLAKLFSKPANLLVLDEPTNDLDVETLELLRKSCSASRGTVLMVSHDRAFLDNVVTSTLVFEGEGKVREFVGGYQDWLRQGGTPHLLGVSESKSGKAELNTALAPAAEPAPAAAARARRRRRKSSATSCSASWRLCPGRSTRSRRSWRVSRKPSRSRISICARRTSSAKPWRGWTRCSRNSMPCSSAGPNWKTDPSRKSELHQCDSGSSR